MGEHVLALDLGGSGLKGALFTPEGHEIAAARQPLAFREGADGTSESDPGTWWAALAGVVEALAATAGARLGDVATVAICGFTRTQVLLDAGGEVLFPALSFRDRRAAALVARPEFAELRIAGLNAFHPLARLAWVKETVPAVWRRLAHVIDPKDELIRRLTGAVGSDRISQHWLAEGFAPADGAPSLASRLGLDRAVLPPAGSPFDLAGTVRGGLEGALGRLAGAAVIRGANDTWMAAAGLGAMAPGRAYCISGSSEVVGLLTERPGAAEGLMALDWGATRRDGGGPHLRHLGGPGQNGANVLDWVRGLAGEVRPAARGAPLLFLPFLNGERVPFWDEALRGGFLGLEARTTAPDLLRAAMEGVAFLDRLVLERAEQATGTRAPALRLAGGGARSPEWAQIRATVLGRPVLVSPRHEMGLAGCLAAALVATGAAEDLAAASGRILPPFRRFEPEPDARARADALYALFQEAHAALRPISHRLAALGQGSEPAPE